MALSTFNFRHVVEIGVVGFSVYFKLVVIIKTLHDVTSFLL